MNLGFDFTVADTLGPEDNKPKEISMLDFANPDFRVNVKAARRIYQSHFETCRVGDPANRPPLSVDLIELILDALDFYAIFGWNTAGQSAIFDPFVAVRANEGASKDTAVDVTCDLLVAFVAKMLSFVRPEWAPVGCVARIDYALVRDGATLPDVGVTYDDTPDDDKMICSFPVRRDKLSPFVMLANLSTKGPCGHKGCTCPPFPFTLVDVFGKAVRNACLTPGKPKPHRAFIQSTPDILIDPHVIRPGVLGVSASLMALHTALFHSTVANCVPIVQITDYFLATRVSAYLEQHEPDRAPKLSFDERIDRIIRSWPHLRDHSITLLADGKQTFRHPIFEGVETRDEFKTTKEIRDRILGMKSPKGTP